MQKNTLKYSAVVFLAGASYGVMAVTVKTAYRDGFTWAQAVASQALFGTLLFAAASLVLLLAGKRPRALTAKGAASLLGLGMCTCTTAVLYNLALSRLPVSAAITLLFQFTWIGIVIQIVATRRRPRAAEIAAAAVILGGTPLASGLLSDSIGAVDPLGAACGLLSAVSCAAFMYFSSRVGVDLPAVERGLVVCLGASVLGLAACPDYFASGALQAGIWKQGILLGAFALFVPVVLFGIGTPHLSPGLSAIMASSELPCAVALSALVLSEPVDALQVAGVAVIMAGAAISQLPNLLPAKRARSGPTP